MITLISKSKIKSLPIPTAMAANFPQITKKKKVNAKRGRKPGSADSVLIKAESLLQYVMPSMFIPVRRKFVEQIEANHGVRLINKKIAK